MPLKEIRAGDFDNELRSRNSPFVVLFEADWCPFCQSFSPIMERRVDKIPVPVVRVPLNDDDDQLWDRYSVDVIPTLAVFDGSRIVFRIDGELGMGLEDADVSRLVEYLKSLMSVK